MDQRWLLSRRALLGGLGALGLASYLGGASRARAATTAATRFIVVHVPEGWWANAPKPTVGAATFGPMYEPLEPYRKYVNILTNLSMASRVNGPGADGHARAVLHMLTGTEQRDENNAGGMSVDQRIAQAIGGASKFASLQFGVRIVYDGLTARPIWAQAGRALPAMQDPKEAYKRVFGELATAAATGKPVIDLRRSALDHAVSEMASLREKLPASDRERLDSYQESLRDIERRLALVAPASCTRPTTPEAVDAKAEANYPKVGRLQTDMMVAALQCGLTRVASLQWGNSNDQCKYSWLGVNTLGHDLAHNNNNCDPTGEKKLKVFRWYAEQFAYLLGKLAAVPEGEGTMLDNTVVLWASEFGSSNSHASKGLMWTVMGNAGGFFRGGQVLDCAGRSSNDLHTSLCNAFGINEPKFGNPAYCDGALAGLG